MTHNYSVSIVGATGLAGGEIVRLLLKHPNITVTNLVGSGSVGTKFGDHHPSIVALRDQVIIDFDLATIAQSDIIFFALPHGKSHTYAAELSNANYNGIIIDVGADHRLERKQDWQKYYGDAGEYSEPFVYGLPELIVNEAHGDTTRQGELLKQAKRIAVAGCNVTAMTLGLQPLIHNALINTHDIVATLANGYSGAGKSLKPHLLAVNAFENVKPYSIAGTHRHLPEIAQNLAKTAQYSADNTQISPDDIKISLTPTLVPMNRGIFASISCSLKEPAKFSDDTINTIFADFYRDESLVHVLPIGENPEILHITGTPYAELNAYIDQNTGRVLILVAIDNLLRGTASMAVQSMNLALGLPETCSFTCDYSR